MSNPKTSITYHVYQDFGFGPYKIGQPFTSEMSAKLFAQQRQSSIEEYYEIRSEIVTETTLDSFTVPAYIPSLKEIAQEIIVNSDGSSYMEWGDVFEQLSDADRSKVEGMVWQEIACCDGCGWHFHADNLEQVEGENLCGNCIDNLEEEDEEDED